MSVVVLFLCHVAAGALKLHQPKLDAQDAIYDEDCGNRMNHKCWKPGLVATSVLSKEEHKNGDKLPVWVPYDYSEASKVGFIELNLKALKKFADPAKFEVHLVTKSNARTFAPDLPKEFERLPDHGALSDVLRAALLARHGGVYMDADVLWTQPLSFFTDKLADHDFIAYTTSGQNCKKGTFSSNIMAARAGNRLFVEWWEKIKVQMTQSCEFSAKDDNKNGACCYTPEGAARESCHVNWGGLGELTAHPIFARLLKDQAEPFRTFCFDEEDHAGFAPPNLEKVLWRPLSTGKMGCSESFAVHLKNAPRAFFISKNGESASFEKKDKQECACWEESSGTLNCADGTNHEQFFGRGAYHMFNGLVSQFFKDASEQEILDGPWVVSKLYRSVFRM